MYVDTNTRRDPDYKEQIFDGLRFDSIEECRGLPSNINANHTEPVQEVHEDSVVIISYSLGEDTVYRPFYVHKFDEDTGLLVCESCQVEKQLFIESGDNDTHLLDEDQYEYILENLIEPSSLGYTISMYPLSVLDIHNSNYCTKISGQKWIPSDNWLAEQVSIDSELLRYYI